MRVQVRSLVPGEEVCRRASSGLILEVNVGEALPVGVADDEAGVGLLDGQGRREAVWARTPICGLTASDSTHDEWASNPDPQE
jgi:hypothetical protein